MSDEINYDIENLRFMVRELNKKGIEVKDKVANIFWQFRYQVTPYWEGENYNNVINFVNEFVNYDPKEGYGAGFKQKTDLVAYEIPKRIEDWINMQAEVGGGQGYTSDLIIPTGPSRNGGNGYTDVWEIPESVISKDGATRISMEKVQQFFIGTQDPSVRGEVESAIAKLNEYISIFDYYDQKTKGNSAAERSRQEVTDFRDRFIESTNYMLEVIIDVATQELNGIEQVDMDTVKKAHEVTSPDTPNPNNPPVTPDPTPTPTTTPTPTSTWTDPCAPKSTWVDPCAPKSTPNPSTTWVDPCAPKSTPNQSTTWTDPCAPRIDPCAPQMNNNVSQTSQNWNEMSHSDRLKRGYLEYMSKKNSTGTGESYLDNNSELTDLEKSEIREIAGKSSSDYTRNGYERADYNVSSSWSELSTEQRVSKTLDQPNMASQLTEAEMKEYNEAQYQMGEHVYYDVPDNGGIYAVKPENLNDRQKVQWAIDVREDVLTNNRESKLDLNSSAYWERTSKNLTVEQIAEVDAEVSKWANNNSDYTNDIKNGYDFAAPDSDEN